MLSAQIIKDMSHEVRQHQHISSHQDIRLLGSLYWDVRITIWTAVLPRASVKVCLNSCWSLSHPEGQCHISAADTCAELNMRDSALFKLHSGVLIMLGAPRSGYSTFSYSNLRATELEH